MNWLRMLRAATPPPPRWPAPLLLAHAAVVRDAWRRVITRDAVKARQASATPEKLRRWAERHYGNRTPVLLTLRPVYALHASLMHAAEPADVLLKLRVDQHCEGCLRELEAVIARTLPADLPREVDRLMTHWAADRPARASEAVLAELLAIE